MAIDVQVSGPCLIAWATSGAYSTLGYTTNDDLPAIVTNRHSLPVTTTQYGDQPREIINRGITGRLSLVLVEYDESELADLLVRTPGATVEGDAGTIGGRWIGSDFASPSRTFKLRITPTLSGQRIYTFPRCYLDENSHRIFDFGNTPKKIGLDIPIVPDDSGDLYTFTTVA